MVETKGLPIGVELFGWIFDAPALVLLVMLAIMVYAMWQAQRRDDFDWGDAFRDDTGKVSALRLGIFVSIGVTTWVLVYVTMNQVKTGADLEQLLPFFVAYGALWSVPKVAEKAIEAILAKFGVLKPTPTPPQAQVP